MMTKTQLSITQAYLLIMSLIKNGKKISIAVKELLLVELILQSEIVFSILQEVDQKIIG